MKKGIWIKGKKKVTGEWEYCWSGDYFVVRLDSKDTVTGQHRSFRVYDDHPEFNGFKLVREESK